MNTGTCYQQLIEQTRRFGRERGRTATVFIIPGGPHAVGRVLLFLGGEPEGLYEFLLHEGGLIPIRADRATLDAELKRPIPLGEYPNLLAALAAGRQDSLGLDAEEFIAPLREFLTQMPCEE